MVINAATRQARRLYVGNLPSTVTEDQLKSFFNDAMLVLALALVLVLATVTVVRHMSSLSSFFGYIFVSFFFRH